MTDLFSLGAIALIMAAFFAGGLVKGALGLGMPVVVLAVLVLIMPLSSAMGVFTLPALLANLWQMNSGPHLRPLARRFWPFMLAAVIGIVIGVRIHAGIDPEAMVAGLGALLILYSGYSLAAPRLPSPGRAERWMGPLAGGSGGVICGMVGLIIVPSVLYLESLRMPRDMFVQTLGLFFVLVTAALAISMAGFNIMTWEMALVSLTAVPPMAAGVALGVRVRHRISEALYRKAFFIALIVTGVYMIARSLG